MTEQQIRIDKYITAMMREASSQVDEIAANEQLSINTKQVLMACYGARWDALNTVRNYVFNMEDKNSEYSRV